MNPYLVLAGVSAVTSAMGGDTRRKQYQLEAKNAELSAKAENINRMSELNQALAMQNLMQGASGSVAGMGSAAEATKESIDNYNKDKRMIDISGRITSAGLRRAGERAFTGSLTQGLLGAAETGIKYSQVGSKTDSKGKRA